MYYFAVYCTETRDNGFGVETDPERFVGKTRAVSGKQAIANIRYRRGEIGNGPRYDRGPVVMHSYRAELIGIGDLS